jgi:hypothetical protein
MVGPAKIMIATPCANGMVTTDYLESVMKLTHAGRFKAWNVSFILETKSFSDLPVARNYFAARFMADESLTHMLFLDADMAVQPSLVQRYLELKKPFVGAVYPTRFLNASRMFSVSALTKDASEAIRLAQDFVCAKSIIGEPENGFCRASRVGTGAMMLSRDVFTTLREAHPKLWLPTGGAVYAALGFDGPVLQCFTPLQSPSGEFLSEDVSFCERWLQAGGEIWSCVDENIVHVGQRRHFGTYATRLARGMVQD